MSPKTLSILAVVTVVLLAVAVVAYSNRAPQRPLDAPRERLFPNLEQRVNDATAIAVSGAESYEIARRGGRWVLVDRGGYPVQFEKVKTALLGLGELELVEEKTSRAERFGELGVADPDGSETSSTQVVVADESGDAMAALIVGDRASGASDGRYVRRVGGDQALLVRGDIAFDGGAMDWVDRNIVGVPRDRIQRAEITHPDGASLFVYRDSADERDLTVSDIPDDRELSFAGAAGSISSALGMLRFEDVAPADERPLDPDDVTTAVFHTFDGLVVTARTDERDDAVWAMFEARVEEPAEPGDADAEDDAEAEAGDEGDADDADVEAEAVRLNETFAGWVFKLPAGQAPNFRKRMEDLTREKPQEEEPAEAPGETEDPPGGDDS